jgi:hypothetical protein
MNALPSPQQDLPVTQRQQGGRLHDEIVWLLCLPVCMLKTCNCCPTGLPGHYNRPHGNNSPGRLPCDSQQQAASPEVVQRTTFLGAAAPALYSQSPR